MATKKYIKPCITIVEISDSKILCSSSDSMKYYCSKSCKFWHMCLDRAEGKRCLDKEYS